VSHPVSGEHKYRDLVLQFEGRVSRLPQPSESKMILSPMGLGTKNHCAGEGQQPFSSQLGIELPTVQQM
jgi:hypothetical protein